ncbi:MAG: cytochrome ubiquinol oxidase subunit I [Bacteroidales bacterium]|nr:cytochrome ubiquinol oxidase subunit I [Bacteroidales bacterium]
MIDQVDMSLVDWSRAQFALTTIYHWLFVPLTLGLSFIIAIMESFYVKTGDEFWKKTTKFWMTIFGINFAIGVATGIILEFEFGTNWSNYSWFVGDIFGAPLAIEGIMAFFLESTFIAVMFFGWNKVSKKFHLISTWLVAIGSNLSAVWILVANAWMQSPVGMHFNPDTARNEMTNFWEVLLSPNAVNKFLHTVSSSYVFASIIVIGISCWYLLKNRELLFAKKSIIIAAAFGLIGAVNMIGSGDNAAREVAKVQPMKFAAMEALYVGQEKAPLVAIGALTSDTQDEYRKRDFIFKIEIPSVLSYMVHLSPDGFIPGIVDLIDGNEERGILSFTEKIDKGLVAIETLKALKEAKGNDEALYLELREKFEDPEWVETYFKYFGYGYFKDQEPASVIPNVAMTFYSFHLMVGLGFLFIFYLALMLYLGVNNKLEGKKWLMRFGLLMIPLAYMATEAGWIVAEVGRQPWVIQDILPTLAAVSDISSGAVKTTFWLFAILFTALLIAELKIMFTQIKIGPKFGGQ